MWLIRLSIFRPVFVTMIEFLLLIMGLIGFVKIGVDLYPKIDPSVVTITTRYSGAGPEEIETLVSKPIEEQMNQLGGIERLTSTSRQGISLVVIEFKLEVDPKAAQIDVQDRLARIRGRLPKEIEEPVVQRADFADKPILQLAVLTKADVPLERRATADANLRFISDEYVKPRLQQIDGVGQIDVFGGLEREIQVDLDLAAMAVWKLTPVQVANAVRSSNVNTPGGELLEEPQRRSLRVLGEYTRVDEIKDTIVKVFPGGKIVRVRDVGEVRDGYKDRGSLARVDGKPAVLVEVRRQSDANTVKVTDALKKKLPELKQFIPEDVVVSEVFDGARVIRASLYDVIETIVIAAVLAIVVVYFFLGSMQSTLITGLALPCTVIATFFVLHSLDFTLNIMTLLGLSLSVGLILDDAIVVRENIWTKIEEGLSPKEAALKGSEQVFIAVLATSATIIATFLPVTLIPGMVGKFFSSFALTVCIAVALSTFDAVTMAPMLSAYMVSSKTHHGEKKLNPVLQFFEDWGDKFSGVYKRLLVWSLANPKKVLASAFGIFVLSLMMVRFIGFSFLPANEYGEIEVSVDGPVGNSIFKTNEIAKKIEETLRPYKEIEMISSRVGSNLAEPNVASVYVKLIPYGHRTYTTAQMKTEFNRALKNLAKDENLVLSVRDAGGGGGGQRPVNVAIQGPDNAKLMEISQTVMAKASEGLGAVANLESSMKPGRAEVQFQVDRGRAAEFGLKPEEIGQTIQGFYEGEIAGQFRERGEEFDIRVRLKPEQRLDDRLFASLYVPNSRDEAIPLSSVAEVKNGFSPTKVVRLNQMRAVRFEGDLPEGVPLGQALQKFGGLLKEVVPDGYQIAFQGQATAMKDLQVGALLAIVLGMVFIYMIMASLYESFVLPFSILLPLPLAIVGAFAALLITAKFLDIYSVIGVIMLMGLVTKNAILVIDYVEQLRREGMNRYDALVLGGMRRLRPIMMTTVAMIAGMLPVAVGYGEINKVRAGMGVATIGGLISSTLLSLLVVPCAYIYLDNFRAWVMKLIRRDRPVEVLKEQNG